jgi:hypothetical protein
MEQPDAETGQALSKVVVFGLVIQANEQYFRPGTSHFQAYAEMISALPFLLYTK